jgi:circadian clock protein KaiC
MGEQRPEATGLNKCPTGIPGFDQITNGGLPRGRPSLVCGGAGCGKTLLAMQFLVNGIVEYDEPGVFIAFEEDEAELTENVASLGWDLARLSRDRMLYLDHVHVERSEIEETGPFNLDGLFIRIEQAANAVKAKRIAVDTLESLFGAFQDQAVLRAEIRRLFRWLKDKGLTAVITGERGEGTFTRLGLEEYISDCVIFLDHRTQDQMAIRRMQVVKYRGTSHGTNQYPFLINENGFSVFPVTELGLDYPVSRQRVSSGVDRLDDMLGGQGYYRKSSVLVSGTAGTGKSSLAASFVRAACARGEKALYLSFEEAEQQIIRNMQSIGLDLQAPVDQGLLKFKTVRATSYGPEMHLSMIIRLIESVDPKVVVVDPISNLINIGTQKETRELLTRLIDFLKMRGITSLFTDLTRAGTSLEATEAEISSLMDTWILLRDIEYNGERNKGLYILKSRGMDHSNQIREFVISQEGLQLKDVYIGPGGVFTGTARVVQEAKERAEGRARRQRIDRLRRGLERKEKALANKIQELKDDFDCEKDEIEQAIEQALGQLELSSQEQEQLARMRGQDKTGASDEH